MATVILKDLHIFRGTKDECLHQPTEDMRIYLAWDTHEIFIGNAVGKKVKYGGSKDLEPLIEEKFEAFRNEIQHQVESAISNLSDEKVSHYISEYDAGFNSRLQQLRTDVDNSIVSIRNEFNQVLEEVSTQVNSKLDDFNDAVNQLTNTDISKLASDIAEINARISELQDIASEAWVREKISEAVTSLADIFYNKTEIDEKVETINSSITSLSEDIGENTTRINNLDTKINNKANELSSVINTKANNSDVYSKADVDNMLSSIKYLRYLTGSQIRMEHNQLVTAGLLSTFVPAFCTLSDGNYTMGSIYYYDPNEFEIVQGAAGGGSGGGSGLTVVDADIRQQIVVYKSATSSLNGQFYTVGNGETVNIDIELSATQHRYLTTIRIATPAAITSLSHNDQTLASSLWSSGTYAMSAVFFTPSTPDDVIRSNVTAVPRDATKNERYTALPNSFALHVVQPTLFGNNNKLTNVGLSSTGTFTASIIANETVYLYTRTPINRITAFGFEVPFESLGQNPLPQMVNGVADVNYYQYSLGNINDNTITINVE